MVNVGVGVGGDKGGNEGGGACAWLKATLERVAKSRNKMREKCLMGVFRV